MKKRTRITLISALIIAATAFTLSAQDTGREVMEKVYNRPSGESMTANLVMTITNSRGAARKRSIIQYMLAQEDVEKKIMFFSAPADVRDTSFMTWSWNDSRGDDQWIYLPALRRVKRISSNSKNDSFMGSDFTYDDLGERHPSEDNHSLLRMEQFKGEECYVIESVPKEKGEAFSKTVSWIVKDKWIGLQRQFNDDDGAIFKTLSIHDFENIDGYWVITHMTMENLEKNSSTTIQMKDVSFSIDVADQFFSERQMKMGPRR